MRPEAEKILTLMRDVPLISTEQAARYFLKNGSPSKRASETLKSLEALKWIEGKRREIGKSKLWRLSSVGRSQVRTAAKKPLPFNTPKIEHVLAVGDLYQALQESGRLSYWKYEPKDIFRAGREMVYAPDAFFVLKSDGGHAPYLLEVQTSNISTSRWADKWAVASLFFDGDHHKKASWQVFQTPIKPKIIVITGSHPDTVTAGSSLPLLIMKNFSPLLI